MSDSLFVSPHNDDETLFGSFILMREKPLVLIVTDSYVQSNRGESITADQRWEETKAAMKVLGCSVVRLGIRDDIIDEWAVKDKLSRFVGFERVYAPAIQGGNVHHDLIGNVAKEIFPECKQYTTYGVNESGQVDLYTTGSLELKFTLYEQEIKEKALSCYKSQLSLPATRPHFEAVKGRSEWLI